MGRHRAAPDYSSAVGTPLENQRVDLERADFGRWVEERQRSMPIIHAFMYLYGYQPPGGETLDDDRLETYLAFWGEHPRTGSLMGEALDAGDSGEFELPPEGSSGRRSRQVDFDALFRWVDETGTVPNIPLPMRLHYGRHSDDFRRVRWRGREFKLSMKRAAMVRSLWEAAQAGAPGVSSKTLKEEAGILDPDQRIQDSFEDLPDWRELIVPVIGRRGYWRLK